MKYVVCAELSCSVADLILCTCTDSRLKGRSHIQCVCLGIFWLSSASPTLLVTFKLLALKVIPEFSVTAVRRGVLRCRPAITPLMDYSQKGERKRATPFCLDFWAPGQFVFIFLSLFFCQIRPPFKKISVTIPMWSWNRGRMEPCFFFNASLEQTENPTRFGALMTRHTSGVSQKAGCDQGWRAQQTVISIVSVTVWICALRDSQGRYDFVASPFFHHCLAAASDRTTTRSWYHVTSRTTFTGELKFRGSAGL